ncbi:MAG: hypothetical protein ACRDFB_10520 [Rhabdochlamydiaceae bacterium]
MKEIVPGLSIGQEKLLNAGGKYEGFNGRFNTVSISAELFFRQYEEDHPIPKGRIDEIQDFSHFRNSRYIKKVFHD